MTVNPAQTQFVIMFTFVVVLPLRAVVVTS